MASIEGKARTVEARASISRYGYAGRCSRDLMRHDQGQREGATEFKATRRKKARR